MSTYSKRFLSGSTNGRPIKVTQVATPGDTVHTAVTGTADIDEVWLYLSNTDAVDRKVTIELGGVTSPDDLIEVTVEAETGLVLALPGLPLQSGLIVKVFAAAANVVNVVGFVNRITA